jgi:hypothetical protein
LLSYPTPIQRLRLSCSTSFGGSGPGGRSLSFTVFVFIRERSLRIVECHHHIFSTVLCSASSELRDTFQLNRSQEDQGPTSKIQSREQIENRAPRIPCNIVTHDAAKRLTNQHGLVSGEINGLEVRVHAVPGRQSHRHRAFD